MTNFGVFSSTVGPSYLPFRFNWFSTCSRARIFRMFGFVLERIQISIQILYTKVFGVTRSWKSSASSFTLSSQFESRFTNGESIKKTSKTDQDQQLKILFCFSSEEVLWLTSLKASLLWFWLFWHSYWICPDLAFHLQSISGLSWRILLHSHQACSDHPYCVVRKNPFWQKIEKSSQKRNQKILSSQSSILCW